MNGDFSTKVTCIFILWEHSPLFKWIGSLENTTTVPLNNKSTNLRFIAEILTCFSKFMPKVKKF